MYASKIKQTLLLLILISSVAGQFPIVINTWAFTNSTINAWNVLNDPQRTPLDALIEGCSTCEREQCDGTVGYGGSPDENGETALDAMIMDGETMNIGAVGGLRQVKDAIAVARHVLENTRHTLLIGERATEFAEMMGFKRESLSTPKSKNLWKAWRLKNCQPNFWTQVKPDPVQSCGPYSPLPGDSDLNSLNECSLSKGPEFGKYNHDTIGMIVVDKLGKMFAGTSSNGAIHKIPGRVGDSPIPGSGAYACNEIGSAAATGDGDIMMRFLPSFTAVESLRQGLSPKSAAENALKRIMKYYKNFRGALIVVSKSSEYGAACAGFGKFPFSVYHEGTKGVRVEYVDCLPS